MKYYTFTKIGLAEYENDTETLAVVKLDNNQNIKSYICDLLTKYCKYDVDFSDYDDDCYTPSEIEYRVKVDKLLRVLKCAFFKERKDGELFKEWKKRIFDNIKLDNLDNDTYKLYLYDFYLLQVQQSKINDSNLILF